MINIFILLVVILLPELCFAQRAAKALMGNSVEAWNASFERNQQVMEAQYSWANSTKLSLIGRSPKSPFQKEPFVQSLKIGTRTVVDGSPGEIIHVIDDMNCIISLREDRKRYYFWLKDYPTDDLVDGKLIRIVDIIEVIGTTSWNDSKVFVLRLVARDTPPYNLSSSYASQSPSKWVSVSNEVNIIASNALHDAKQSIFGLGLHMGYARVRAASGISIRVIESDVANAQRCLDALKAIGILTTRMSVKDSLAGGVNRHEIYAALSGSYEEALVSVSKETLAYYRMGHMFGFAEAQLEDGHWPTCKGMVEDCFKKIVGISEDAWPNQPFNKQPMYAALQAIASKTPDRAIVLDRLIDARKHSEARLFK